MYLLFGVFLNIFSGVISSIIYSFLKFKVPILKVNNSNSLNETIMVNETSITESNSTDFQNRNLKLLRVAVNNSLIIFFLYILFTFSYLLSSMFFDTHSYYSWEYINNIGIRGDHSHGGSFFFFEGRLKLYDFLTWASPRILVIFIACKVFITFLTEISLFFFRLFKPITQSIQKKFELIFLGFFYVFFIIALVWIQTSLSWKDSLLSVFVVIGLTLLSASSESNTKTPSKR
ncbi:hypothetical protein DID80_06770 [Candidatus Marinamargulisbacteria bacterium SCGC AAA071-K20]|nr:hypothetical protein DID80_06770 [Candidatus Marinamargulisbacteria bacterium SCGC AAA071-K20]